MRDGDPIEIPDDLKDTTPWHVISCPVCKSDVEHRLHGLRSVAAYGDETLAYSEYRPKQKDQTSEALEVVSLREQVQRMDKALKEIGALVDNPHWTNDRKYKISEVVRKARYAKES